MFSTIPTSEKYLKPDTYKINGGVVVGFGANEPPSEDGFSRVTPIAGGRSSDQDRSTITVDDNATQYTEGANNTYINNKGSDEYNYYNNIDNSIIVNPPGTPGADGAPGLPGAPGTSGSQGPAGPAGADGTNVTPTRRAKIQTSGVSTSTLSCKLLGSDGNEIGNAITVYAVEHLGTNALSGAVWPKLAATDNIPIFQDLNGIWYTTFIFDDTTTCEN
jgi:hypothetical protein